MIGVYFLIKDDVIVYIGQSINVEKRITQHTKKEFDSFRVIQCEQAKLLYYERRLIRYFKPVLNGGHGGPRPGAGRPKLQDHERKEPTKVIRVPISRLNEVKKLLENDK